MLRGHRKAQAATAKHRDKLLALPGVTGVFTGRKTVGGEKTDRSSVVISVAKKKRLPAVPKAQRIPPELDGIPTDVIQESFHTCTDDLTRYDPFQGGGRISVTPDLDDSFAAGTAGMIVSDVETKDPMILSCWHVLYGSGVGTEGDIVVNPPYSGGDPGPDTVGKLTRAVINSTADAAVARVEGRAYSREIIGIGTPVALASAAVDMPVKKRGSASGLTTGTVTATDWSGPVDFGGIMGIITFTNIIRFEGDAGMVLGGDSGSVLCQGEDPGDGGNLMPIDWNQRQGTWDLGSGLYVEQTNTTGTPSASAQARLQSNSDIDSFVGQNADGPNSFTLIGTLDPSGHERNQWTIFIGYGTVHNDAINNPIMQIEYDHPTADKTSAGRTLGGSSGTLSTLLLADLWTITLVWDRGTGDLGIAIEDEHSHSSDHSVTGPLDLGTDVTTDDLWFAIETRRYVDATSPIRFTYLNLEDDEA